MDPSLLGCASSTHVPSVYQSSTPHPSWRPGLNGVQDPRPMAGMYDGSNRRQLEIQTEILVDNFLSAPHSAVTPPASRDDVPETNAEWFQQVFPNLEQKWWIPEQEKGSYEKLGIARALNRAAKNSKRLENRPGNSLTARQGGCPIHAKHNGEMSHKVQVDEANLKDINQQLVLPQAQIGRTITWREAYPPSNNNLERRERKRKLGLM
ncbi:hypothetical protein YB2330_003553 [Saitoella coloradoensis]